MQTEGPARHFDLTMPAAGLHLLDVSMFWGPTGGVRRVLSTKHARLPAHGWRHTILAPGVDPGVDGEGHVGCGGLPLPASGGYRVVVRRGAAERLIEQAAPDVVEAADPYTLAWAVLGATHRLGVPAVAFCHSDLPALAARLVGGIDGMDTRRGRWAARRARDYLVRLYAGFDLVMAPSRGLTDRLRAWGVQQVVHQPLGVDCTVFTPAARDSAWRQRLCGRLGLAPSTRLLAYSGRFAPEKNLHLLADAVRLLGPGHALLALGSGPQPPSGPGVHLLPPEPDSARLARFLASCDAYVHAGDQETFGLGVLEAMACGTPIVVAAAGGLGELASDDAGVPVPRQRATEWADAISAVTGRPGPVLPAVALARAREHDWGAVLEQLTRRYLGLMEQNPRRQRPLSLAWPAPSLPATSPAGSQGPWLADRP